MTHRQAERHTWAAPIEVPLAAAGAGGSSSGECVSNCMSATSAIASCTCYCGGKNHGAGESATRNAVPEVKWPHPNEDQRALENNPSQENVEAEKHLSKWYRTAFPGVPESTLPDYLAESVEAYFKDGHKAINKALRTDDPEERAKRMKHPMLDGEGNAQGVIEDLRKVMKSSALPQDTTVYRGLPKGVVERLAAGSVMEDPGFLSTSLDPTVPSKFGEATLKIHAPKGTNYISGGLPGEYELVLPEGSRMRILGVEHHTQEDGTSRPYLQATMEEA